MPKGLTLPFVLLLAGLAGLAWMTYFGGSTQPPPEAPALAGPPPEDAPGPYLDIEVAGEAEGTITIDLFEQAAPAHAERLMALAREGAYDDVVFHRVIDGFMAQTGDVQYGRLGQDMRRAGMGGSALPDLPAEFSAIPFQRGTVGMARSQSPDSANSQFFIMFDAAPHLDGGYTAVGRVTDGMEVVDDIRRGTGQNGAVTGQPDRMVRVTVRE